MLANVLVQSRYLMCFYHITAAVRIVTIVSERPVCLGLTVHFREQVWNHRNVLDWADIKMVYRGLNNLYFAQTLNDRATNELLSASWVSGASTGVLRRRDERLLPTQRSDVCPYPALRSQNGKSERRDRADTTPLCRQHPSRSGYKKPCRANKCNCQIGTSLRI